MRDQDLEVVEDALTQIGEDLPLLRARMRHIASLGFRARQAAELAVSGIDVGELERLVGMGCPPETAAAIVR